MGYLFHELKNNSNTGLTTFLLDTLRETYFSKLPVLFLNMNLDLFVWFFFFLKPQDSLLCSCYYFSINGLALFLFPAFIGLFFLNNNIWVQGQHCQNLSCKITPGLTLNYRWQVCQIIWGNSKVRRLIFHVVVFGQQAFMEHSVKPSLYQVPQNIAIICKELTVW